MGGAQPLAATMAGAAILCVEVDPSRIERRLETRYLDEVADSLDDALGRVRAAARRGVRSPSACSATRQRCSPSWRARGERFDLVTDQTAAHDPLTGYVPAEVPFEEAAALRERDPGGVRALAARVDRRARAGDDGSRRPGAMSSTTATTSGGRRMTQA